MVPTHWLSFAWRKCSRAGFVRHVAKRCGEVGTMRVLIGPSYQVERPVAQMSYSKRDFAVIARYRAVNKVKPGILFDANDFPTALEAATINRARRRVFLKLQEIPITPQCELIFKMEYAVGRKSVALTHGVSGITQPHKLS